MSQNWNVGKETIRYKLRRPNAFCLAIFFGIDCILNLSLIFCLSTKLSAGGGDATSSVWRIHWACDPVRVHHPIRRHISPGPSPSPHQQHIWDQDRCIQIHHPAEEAGRRPSKGYWDLAPNTQLYQLHGCVFKCEQIVNLRKRKCNVLMTPLWFSFHRPW